MEARDPARILIVDDEVRAQRLISRVLGRSGYPCIAADSAADALERLRGEPTIDVVISDIYMPTVGGIEFLGAVRREFADRPWLQMLLVTGQASVETAVAAMRLDASDYLFKPIDPKLLRESVRHALARAESIRRIHEMTQDSPGAHELRRIAGTARALAADLRRAVASGPVAERGADATGQPGSSTLTMLEQLQRLEEARSSIFGEAVMPEPAWEMLAELMRAKLVGRHLSVTSLAMSSKSPMTTALRRIEDLIEGGLAARVPDPSDRRRTHVELTPDGMARMRLFLEGFARTALESA